MQTKKQTRKSSFVSRSWEEPLDEESIAQRTRRGGTEDNRERPIRFCNS
jgi:hypothetical protein